MKKNSEYMKKILKKAAQDKAFKKKLLENPEAALKELNIPLPKGVKLKFLENTKDTYYFVLPNTLDEVETSDEEIKKIAGGTTIWDASTEDPNPTDTGSYNR